MIQSTGYNRISTYGELLWEHSLWISIATLNFSTALSSVFFGAFALRLLFVKYSDSSTGNVNKRWFGYWGLLIFLIVIVASIFKSSSFLSLLGYIQIKLPLLLVLVAFVFNVQLAPRTSNSWLFYLLPHCWIVTASCIHYFQHWQFYSMMVLESKPIPMFTQIYHIEYGALVALSIVMFFDDYFSKRIFAVDRGLGWLIVALTMLGLHVLALRTGLIMLYVGIVLVAAKYSKRSPLPWLRPAILIPVIIGTFLLLTALLPSVRHRVKNTLEDAAIIVRGGDTNHRSLGQRVEAWRAAFSAINSNPGGVGIEGEFAAMMQGYEDTHSQLSVQHRIGIHNQWLQLGVQGGWLAMVLTLMWLIRGVFKLPSGYWLIMLMVGLAVESFLERQSGILICVLTLLAAAQEPKEIVPIEEKNR